MANPNRREALSHHISEKEAVAAGFPSGTDVSGDFMPKDRLLTYYNGRVTVDLEGKDPVRRKVILLTDGQQWFVGVQAASVDTHLMLEALHRGIQNGQRARHAVNGRDLGDVLKDPASLPEIELPKNEKPKAKIDTRSHSFE